MTRRHGVHLTGDELTSLTDEELEAWTEAHAIGSWEPNDADAAPPPTEVITIKVPRELLMELRIEATIRSQPWPRYAKDLLFLAVREVQAARSRRVSYGLAPRTEQTGPARRV